MTKAIDKYWRVYLGLDKVFGERILERAYSFLIKQAFRLFEKHLQVFLVKTIEAGAKYETYF